MHEVFETQRIEHAFLEPESTLAVPTRDAGGERHLHVYSGGQGVWDDRNQIASVLAVEPQTITVELVSNGGAFGGKEDMANQAHAALAAWLLQRPVKCVLSREESLRMHAKRHPIEMAMTTPIPRTAAEYAARDRRAALAVLNHPVACGFSGDAIAVLAAVADGDHDLADADVADLVLAALAVVVDAEIRAGREATR